MWRAFWILAMKKQIVNVSAVQAGKVIAALYFVCSFPVLLLMGVSSMFSAQSFPVLLMIAMPVLYAAIGFVFTVIGALLYNLVAARVGGIEFTTREVGGGL